MCTQHIFIPDDALRGLDTPPDLPSLYAILSLFSCLDLLLLESSSSDYFNRQFLIFYCIFLHDTLTVGASYCFHMQLLD
jgi:hypothetical protein